LSRGVSSDLRVRFRGRARRIGMHYRWPRPACHLPRERSLGRWFFL